MHLLSPPASVPVSGDRGQIHRLWLLARFGGLLGLGLGLSPLARATKATAPFDVAAQFKEHHATVSVRALSPATDVVVEISGSDGLVVAGGEMHGTVAVKSYRRASVTAGEVLTYEVDFTPGGARSLLGVSVDCAGEPALVRGFYPADQAQPAPAAAAMAMSGPAAAAGKPGWPIHADTTFDASQQHAHVIVTTSRPGTDIVVKMYGLDGLIVTGGSPEGALVVRTERQAALKPGEKFEFDVTLQPGEGQSYLVVSAQGQGIGTDLRTFPVGELSKAQRVERQRGVTMDPEGHPIKVMGP